MDGSTGYDVLREIGGVLVDPQGESPLTALVESAGVDYQEMPAMLADLKVHAAVHTLASELRRLRRCIAAAAGADHPLLPAAVAALLRHIGRYRCDYPAKPPSYPARWLKPIRQHHNWHLDCS